jgi:antirestriction protein ArdC
MNTWEKFNDVAEKLTSEIIDGINTANLTWEKVWNPINAPRNYFSKRHYLGFNALYLSYITQKNNYSSPYFLSFKQAKDLKGNVKKGAKGYTVIFWKISKFIKGEVKDESTGESELLFQKRFTPFIWTVFNIDQIEGIEFNIPNENRTFEPIEACLQVIESYPNKPEITHSGDQAYYSPLLDLVNMPNPETFKSDQFYYSVLFHELIHSTGHKSRLNRFDTSQIASFGSIEYSKEELIAEIGASFLNAYIGIQGDTFKNSLAYLQGWIKPLKNDPKMLIYASQKAHQAARFILNITEEGED